MWIKTKSGEYVNAISDSRISWKQDGNTVRLVLKTTSGTTDLFELQHSKLDDPLIKAIDNQLAKAMTTGHLVDVSKILEASNASLIGIVTSPPLTTVLPEI